VKREGGGYVSVLWRGGKSTGCRGRASRLNACYFDQGGEKRQRINIRKAWIRKAEMEGGEKKLLTKGAKNERTVRGRNQCLQHSNGRDTCKKGGG